MLPPVPSPSPLPLQPALPVYKPPPINSVGDRVTNCLHSFRLNAGLGNSPTNRGFYVRSCVNNRSSDQRGMRAFFVSRRACGPLHTTTHFRGA
jgi:hypothetical protein